MPIKKITCLQNTNKSIFKQATYRNIYDFKTFSSNGVPLFPYVYYKIDNNIELIKDEILHTCDLELPILNEGDKFYIVEFYIVELDKTVIIKERIRTSDESYMYICKDEYIDDEKSLETKEKAELQRDLYFKNKRAEQKLEKLENHWLIGKLIKIFNLND